MNRIFHTIILCLVHLATCSGQPYRFRVERLELQAWVQPDASLRLQYKIEFQNAPGRTPSTWWTLDFLNRITN